MNDPDTNNFHAVVKEVNKFEGKRAGDFLEWQAKLCNVLNLYSRSLFNFLQGVQRSSSAIADGATNHAAWNIQFSILGRSQV